MPANTRFSYTGSNQTAGDFLETFHANTQSEVCTQYLL